MLDRGRVDETKGSTVKGSSVYKGSSLNDRSCGEAIACIQRSGGCAGKDS